MALYNSIARSSVGNLTMACYAQGYLANLRYIESDYNPRATITLTQDGKELNWKKIDDLTIHAVLMCLNNECSKVSFLVGWDVKFNNAVSVALRNVWDFTENGSLEYMKINSTYRKRFYNIREQIQLIKTSP